MTIDWSKAPEGATHFCPPAPFPWLRNGVHPDFFNEDREEWRAYGNAEIGKRDVARSVRRPLQAPVVCPYGSPAHPDNLAVHDLSNAMRNRLAECREAGKSGWDDRQQCPPQRLADGLVRAMRKGELVDVANYAAMLLARSKSDMLTDAMVHALLVAALGRTAGEPAPVEWDGTGLPPAGTVCEFNAEYTGWEQVAIAAHVTKRSGTSFVLFERSADTWHWESNPKRLRPILTPEQRDAAVAAMLADAGVTESAWKDDPEAEVWAAALYAAGWRKTEGEA